MAQTLTYMVTGMSCAHCKAAVKEELLATRSVEAVDVDLDAKEVVVTGEALDDAALRAAIVEAGYEAS
jgi:copper chaperone CopZ